MKKSQIESNCLDSYSNEWTKSFNKSFKNYGLIIKIIEEFYIFIYIKKLQFRF